jgi:lipoprotein-anchoring transpeptidase ErfK/SrfK
MRAARALPKGALVAVLTIMALALAGGVYAAVRVLSSRPASADRSTVDSEPIAAAKVTVAGLRHGHVPWNKRITLRVTNGSFTSVAVTRDGTWALDGVMRDHATRWISATTLVPTASYTAVVEYVDDANRARRATLSFSAADTDKHLRATLSPGDGNVVGVGSPVVVSFSRAVPVAKRAMVQGRLSVVTSPAVIGAWHWMNDQEVHWRPPAYWRSGTAVTVHADLSGLDMGGGIWGAGAATSSFRIGPSHISRVDVARHMMYVYTNGKLVQTFPISAGRDKYPTKNGVHITFEKSQVVTMDSATVGIPRNSPDGYYEKVYWDVRISYGGAFVHAAPWSVGDQGRVNVSHGCVNISTSNAIWFYNYSLRGDIVDVYNSGAAPDYSDPGMADWNMSWNEWVAGDADPSPQALALHPRLPRDNEPAAPPYTPPYTPSPRPSSSPSRSPSPTPTPTKTPHH